MDKVIYLEESAVSGSCGTSSYHKFIDYAFTRADYFMLVYVNYGRCGYTSHMKKYLEQLNNYRVKVRNDPHWPGTPSTESLGSTYEIVFYKTSDQAKMILKNERSISDWSRPEKPQDLAFFIGNHCWFYSVGHEKIAAMINPENTDIEFLERNGFANSRGIICTESDYFKCFNEVIA